MEGSGERAEVAAIILCFKGAEAVRNGASDLLVQALAALGAAGATHARSLRALAAPSGRPSTEAPKSVPARAASKGPMHTKRVRGDGGPDIRSAALKGVLRLLDVDGGEYSTETLAEEFKMDLRAMELGLIRLEKKGLLARGIEPGTWELTPAGEAAARQLKEES
jgi:hypothetical protein